MEIIQFEPKQMNPLIGLPLPLEERLSFLRAGLKVFFEGDGDKYQSLIRHEIHEILYLVKERDKQVKEAIDWYKVYIHNHARFMHDYPEHISDIENLSKEDYRIKLLDYAFKGLL